MFALLVCHTLGRALRLPCETKQWLQLFNSVIQDVGLPYMLDPRHPEDSLFFVAESDYRFYPGDCISNWYEILEDEDEPWLDERLTEVVPPTLALEAPSPSPVRDDDPSPSPDEQELPKVPQKRKFLGWSAAQRPESKASELEVSQELRDMVQICNRAAKIGRGHVVWFGWCPQGKQKSIPAFASHLLAMSKYGAKTMLESMEAGRLKMGHWDRVLRAWLVEENFQNPKVMGASFVWPSVGFYQTHASGCEPSIGDRVAEWDQSFIQPGVRPFKDSHRKRWLACWPDNKKGGAEWLEQITFDARKNIWITQPPPDRWWSTDSDWVRLLWNRWWIGNEGEWIGPRWAADTKGKGKGKQKKRGPMEGLCADEQVGIALQTPRRLRVGRRCEGLQAFHEARRATGCGLGQLALEWSTLESSVEHAEKSHCLLQETGVPDE